jgi:Outer membrane lipoprotein carrier protein LolA-like
MRTSAPTLTRMRRLAVALALAALPWGAFAQAFDLPALMALLAQRKTAEARFTEERTVTSLDSPLMSSGTLSFAAPDRFTRVQLEPRAESMEVQGNTAILKRGGRTRTMALDSIPELAALVDAVRGTLSGDAARLKQHFRTEVGGNAARWQLALVPIDRRLAEQVARIEIVGVRTDVRSIDLRLAGGDRSLMQVEPIAGK